MLVKPPLTNFAKILASFHPIIIEGMGSYDHREPKNVAKRVVARLENYWFENPPVKPLLLMTQGDPRREKGISAITPLVADYLGVPRGIVILDEKYDRSHSYEADRENVILEFKYSQLLEMLDQFQGGLYDKIEKAIDLEFEKKDYRRAAVGKKPQPYYFRTFALLQEVTKAVCKLFCNDISIVHTSAKINEFSVSTC